MLEENQKKIANKNLKVEHVLGYVDDGQCVHMGRTQSFNPK